MTNIIDFQKVRKTKLRKEKIRERLWDNIYVDFEGDLSDLLLLWNQGIIYDLDHLEYMKNYKQKIRKIVGKSYTNSEFLNLMECEFKKRENRKDLQQVIEKSKSIKQEEFDKIKHLIPDVDQIISYDHDKDKLH